MHENIDLPGVSILVLNYNGKQHLEECLESLKALDYPEYEIILVDNASTDGSVEYVRQDFPNVKIVAHDRNYGFCEGYNRAVAHAEYDYIAFLNNDTRVEPDWLIKLVKGMFASGADICGSKILLYYHPQRLNHFGAMITPIGSGYDIGFGAFDNHGKKEPFITGAVCGAAMLLKKDLFLKLGGFDADYFAYFDDLDLCWRAWLAGYKVMLVPTSVVHHKFGASWGSDRRSVSRTYYGQKNRLANMVKNFAMPYLIRGFAITVVYDLVRFFMFLLTGNFSNISAMLGGTGDFMAKMPLWLKKRKIIQGERKISDGTLSRMGLMASTVQCFREFIRLEKVFTSNSP